MKTTVIIPNYNGIDYIGDCLDSLRKQTEKDFKIIVVDNFSTDGSYEYVKKNYKEVEIIRFFENTGFSKAVNAGIRAADTPYVILLNNDTKALPRFVEALTYAIEKSPNLFSVSAKMLQMDHPEFIDDAGDFYCALGWACARGKDQSEKNYNRGTEIFASCAGAAIYRRSIFSKIGLFDELHFAYLEDIDIGYRARIKGFKNRFEPRAKVLHAGSASSGSRYNEFKVKLSAANSVYIIYKNMPLFQLVLNLPLIIIGFFIKFMFFISKGLGKIYLIGLFDGFKKCVSKEGRNKKIYYREENLSNYLKIQMELWKNILYFL